MKPFVNKKFKLERYPGKGGWTYARIPKPDTSRFGFGWTKVKGSIDGYRISKVHLMPMGHGKNEYFFPVKAEIRKQIGKEHGDYVTIILYPDRDPLEIPDEFLSCLKDEPRALDFFKTLTQSQQKYYINWIASAKRIETKVERLTKAVERLARRTKFYDRF